MATDGLERAHVRSLRRIWRISKDVIDRGLAPLLIAWPYRGDALPHPGETVYPAPGEPPRGYSPLAPQGQVPRIWNLSDRVIKGLWPEVDPSDVREFAPWAVSYKEVRRLTTRATATIAELRRIVAEAIRLEKIMRPLEHPAFRLVESTRQRGAFRLRYSPEAMAIIPPTGPLGPPPMVSTVSADVIERQISWLRIALEAQIREDTIVPAVQNGVDQVEKLSYNVLNRVVPIDLEQDIPEIREERGRWYRDHVSLIKSGILGPDNSLLEDAAEVIRTAHEQGLRVEELAGALQARYGVSDSRAELIARDQILKANGRMTRIRQQAAGIDRYTWISSRDKRTRESHARLHGTVQRWDAPPSVGGGRHEHPGGDYQCRCIAKPVLPAWMRGEK